MSPAPTVLVVAPLPRSGKSELARRIAARLGLAHVESSSVVVAELERRRGLPPGTVAAERAVDPHRHRAELIAIGDEMTRAGRPAGVVCVERTPAAVVDGIRRGVELAAARAAAERAGRRPVVICLDRPAATTEVADGAEAGALRAAADLVLFNPMDGHARLEELADAAVAFIDRETHPAA